MDGHARADLISRIPPPRDLTAYVEAFAGRTALGPQAAFPVFPTARAELIFHFGDPFLVGEQPENGLRRLAPVVLLGPRRETYWQSAGPRIDWFMIQLSPLGCRRLVDVRFAELWGREAPVSAAWALGLHERLAETSSFARRATLAATALRTIHDCPTDSLSSTVSLARAGRFRRLDDLCARLDVGPRRLHQLFVAEAGIGPKLFLSMMRFGRQLEGLHPRPLLPASQADEPEYADQSHAIREFRRFAGVTPGAYVAQKRTGDRLVYTGAAIPLDR